MGYAIPRLLRTPPCRIPFSSLFATCYYNQLLAIRHVAGIDTCGIAKQGKSPILSSCLGDELIGVVAGCVTALLLEVNSQVEQHKLVA